MSFQTFTPLEYLKIDVASNFGLEKENWDTRISWFNDNEHSFEPLIYHIEAGKPVQGTLMAEAAEPAMFYAGLKAWQKASRGEAISYPISLDATASGAQILAILIGCEKSASLCNVVDAGSRRDLYMDAYQTMLNLVGDTAKITRSDIKEAVMPSFYGSTARPKQVFGEGALLSAFHQVMEEELPGIWYLNQAMKTLWNPDALEHAWVLPDNFHVKVKVIANHMETVSFLNRPYEVYSKINAPTPEGRSISANVVHSIDGMVVREMLRRCSYDQQQLLDLIELLTSDKPLYAPLSNRAKDHEVKTLWAHYKATGFLSARILELLDDENLSLVDQEVIKAMVATLPDKPFSVLSVHDCFRVHPNYGNDLRRQYNQILHELAQSTILASIASQLNDEPTDVAKYGDLSKHILETNYALS